MGNMIGSGVFLLPASLAIWRPEHGRLDHFRGGRGVLALVFARLASFSPASGGPYVYTRQAFGDFAGFLVAWGYWISIWTRTRRSPWRSSATSIRFFRQSCERRRRRRVLAIGVIWLLTA